MLGIKNYTLNPLGEFKELESQMKSQLKELIGQHINSYYLQWDSSIASKGQGDLPNSAWNEDGPIVLCIGNKQFEFTAYQLDYSLTINQIDLIKPLNWYDDDDLNLQWKENPIQTINNILFKPIKSIYVLEFLTGETYQIAGFEFQFEHSEECLHLSNGLDCNVVKLGEMELYKGVRKVELIG